MSISCDAFPSHMEWDPHSVLICGSAGGDPRWPSVPALLSFSRYTGNPVNSQAARAYRCQRHFFPPECFASRILHDSFPLLLRCCSKVTNCSWEMCIQTNKQTNKNPYTFQISSITWALIPPSVFFLEFIKQSNDGVYCILLLECKSHENNSLASTLWHAL